jgi:hypothetical protein
MNLRLILGEKTARNAMDIWRNACTESNHSLEVLDPRLPATRELIAHLHLNTFPALILEDRVVAVGSPTPESARQLIRELSVTHTDTSSSPL